MTLTVLNVAYPFAPVGPDAVGGAEQVLAALDRGLAQRGHRSVVIACTGSVVAGELIAGPSVTGQIDDRTRRRTWAAWRQAIAGRLAGEAIDVVHLHGIDLLEYLPDAVPTLATLHLPLDWYPPRLFQRRARLSLNCVSATQHAGRPSGARFLPPIANGVPPQLFATACRKRDHCIMLSRICPEKGVHLALQACRRADVPLLVGGRVFPYPEHQRYFAEELRPLLDRRRRFLGPLGFDRKRRLLASARCALVPSLAAETSSLAAIEALACGTPVVAFANGALPSIIDHGKTGFIVANVAEMAEAIAAAGELDPMACRAAAAERFSLDRMVDGYLAAYRRVAADTPDISPSSTAEGRRPGSVRCS